MNILFLCAHGGAKSVMAASYFNRLAKEHALPYAAVAASVEDPYASVPEPVTAFLQKDGFEIREFTPRRVGQRDLSAAARTVTIGCALPGADAERWDDVPAASEDLEGSAAAIRRHVDVLIEELRGRR